MSSPAASRLLLVILDGFGHRAAAPDNAIACASTPNWDAFLAKRPHTLLSGSGVDVGLPAGQMGNSEVGHMVIGAGRIIHQDLARVNEALADGRLGSSPPLNAAFDRVRAAGGVLHVMGLLSPGGVHSHEDQILALIRLAHDKGVPRILLHAFLDGRDTPPKSAGPSLQRAENLLRQLRVGRIASICGRYYAMDRDQRWDRTQRAYELIVGGDAPVGQEVPVGGAPHSARGEVAGSGPRPFQQGQGGGAPHSARREVAAPPAPFAAASPAEALQLAYDRGETDEFVQPTRVGQADAGSAGASQPGACSGLTERDALLFMNFRADRARQLTSALSDQDFQGFQRNPPPPIAASPLHGMLTLTQYADDLPVNCILPPLEVRHTLGECLARQGKRQLRAAETEKYAHVTFFFSGGREAPFAGEERLLVPSPRVATYDLKPRMSAEELTDRLLEAILGERFDAVICNYANGDMVGHTGQFAAAVAAVETLDRCLGRLAQAIAGTQWHMLITADHGNVEQMQDRETGQPHTAHTLNPVPLVHLGPTAAPLAAGGALADVAPTALALLNLPQPAEMTGRSLLTGKGAKAAVKAAAASAF